MKYLGFRVAAALFLAMGSLVPLAILPSQAAACSCAYVPIPNDLRFNDTVFSGQVLRVGDGWAGGDSSSPREVLVAVDHVWVGNVSGQVTVVSASSEASCGYESFVEGKRFLIYAKARGDVYETNLCSPTRPYDSAAVKLLEGVAGPGVDVKSRESDVDTKERDSSAWTWMVLATGVVAAGAVVATLLTVRRRSRANESG